MGIAILILVLEAVRGTVGMEVRSPRNNSDIPVQCPCDVSIFLPVAATNLKISIVSHPYLRSTDESILYKYVLRPVVVDNVFQNYTGMQTVKYRFKYFQKKHLILNFQYSKNIEDRDKLPFVSLYYDDHGSACPILFPEHPPLSVNQLSQEIERTPEKIFRIVGGVPSSFEIASYLVLFTTSTNNGPARTCTGTLVSPDLAISAAHCRLSKISKAIIGTEDPSNAPWEHATVKQFTPHPKFNMSSGVSMSAKYDIAYVRLEGHIPDRVRFMKVNTRREIPKAASNARAVGYGILKSQMIQSNPSLILHQVDLPLIRGSKCTKIYNQLSVDITESLQICAGYEGHDCGAW